MSRRHLAMNPAPLNPAPLRIRCHPKKKRGVSIYEGVGRGLGRNIDSGDGSPVCKTISTVSKLQKTRVTTGRGWRRVQCFDADCDAGPSRQVQRNKGFPNGQSGVFSRSFSILDMSNIVEARIACRRSYQATRKNIQASVGCVSRQGGRKPPSGGLHDP